MVGHHIAWTDIVGQVFRVRDFDKGGTTIGPSGEVRSGSAAEPYGHLVVESPILNQAVKLPIIHRDDYLLASSVFDEPELADLAANAELLVTYVPKQKLPGGLAGTTHALHYVIVPLGTLQRYYEVSGDAHMAKPAPQKLFGDFVYEGELKVQINSDPQL